MALYLAMRQGAWQPNDIDVYVGEAGYGAFCEEFVLTMNAEEAPIDGQVSSPIVEPSYSPGIKHVRKFNTVFATYDVIQSTGDAWLPLMLFHSTFLVNALTHNCLVIACPPYTLNMCGMHQYERQACIRTQKAFSKYIGRGFSYVGDLSEALKTKVGGPMFIPLDHRQSFDSSEHILRRVFAKGWAWMHFGMAEEDDKVQR